MESFGDIGEASVEEVLVARGSSLGAIGGGSRGLWGSDGTAEAGGGAGNVRLLEPGADPVTVDTFSTEGISSSDSEPALGDSG